VPKNFLCSVVTPERVVLETEATFVALPAHDGEIGFLRDRAPIVFKLDAGSLRIKAAGESQVLYVDGGFAEMVDNRLTILTEVARFVDELDRDEARASLESAEAMKVADEASFQARQRALKGAQAQLRLLQ